MLELGNLSPYLPAESRTHFALWAAMKSPLLVGTDLSRLRQHDLSILKNKYLLAFNQDPVHGDPAKPYKWGTNPDWTFDKRRPAEFWAGRGQEGVLVLVVNTDEVKGKRTVVFAEVPGLQAGKGYVVRDVWTDKKSKSCVRGRLEVEIEAHDTGVWLFETVC